MYLTWVRNYALWGLAGAVCILLAFSFQYPLSVHAPIGGDAQSHIQRVRYPFEAPPYQLASSALTSSRYPFTLGMFITTHALPVSWEMRFMLWMALGHTLTGLLLGYLLYRIAGWWPAILGMIFWAASTMEVLPFFRAATMPQLWSLPFLLLAMQQLARGSLWWSILVIGTLYFAHPITLAVAGIPLILALPSMLIWRYMPNLPRTPLIASCITALLATALAITAIYASDAIPYASFSFEEPWPTLREILSSHYGPVILLAPLGVIFLGKTSAHRNFRLFFTLFAITSLLFTVNEMLGGSSPGKRFIPYAILSCAFLSPLALHYMMRKPPFTKWMRIGVGIIIATIVGIGGWNIASNLYHAFDNDCEGLNYVCPTMTADERIVYQWADAHLPQDAVILTSDSRARATEWIPVIANRGVRSPRFAGQTSAIFTESCERALRAIQQSKVTHGIFYTYREDIPDTFRAHPDIFRIIYHKHDIAVVSFPDHNAIETSEKRTMLCE